ncbi:hypothetical protein Y032_0098g3111 [Ancylostoma ceylanicum]|uniref:Uncharacterized protein n=1 Tax=Ancylostoma ceylanicum TaxID=53326 RepID=A0A016TJK4_9BILA|nr:hypothetical protein Y032_0098g3111 [Ancylostoma ceylanicum]
MFYTNTLRYEEQYINGEENNVESLFIQQTDNSVVRQQNHVPVYDCCVAPAARGYSIDRGSVGGGSTVVQGPIRVGDAESERTSGARLAPVLVGERISCNRVVYGPNICPKRVQSIGGGNTLGVLDEHLRALCNPSSYPNNSFSQHRTLCHMYEHPPAIKATMLHHSLEAPLERNLLEALEVKRQSPEINNRGELMDALRLVT